MNSTLNASLNVVPLKSITVLTLLSVISQLRECQQSRLLSSSVRLEELSSSYFSS